METLQQTFVEILLGTLLIFIIFACSKSDLPTTSPKATDFKIVGKISIIEGSLKPTSKLSAEQMKKHYQTAADQLDLLGK